MNSDRDKLIAGLRPLVPDEVNVISQECPLETVAEAAAGDAPPRAKVARAWKQWQEGAGRAELLRAKALAANANGGHADVADGRDLVLVRLPRDAASPFRPPPANPPIYYTVVCGSAVVLTIAARDAVGREGGREGGSARVSARVSE